MHSYRELAQDVPNEYQALKESAHRFAAEVLRPVSIELDRLADPRDVIGLDSPLRRVFKKGYELGYHIASLPAELGGLGLSGLGTHILIEELSWGAVDLALSLLCASFPFSAAAASGNPQLFEEFVKPFINDRSGTMIGCWASTEPHYVSDTLIVGTSDFHNPRVKGQVIARREGDHYLITGQKAAWVSNGTLATHAALYCTTEPVHGMAGGGIAFVPLDLRGVSKGKPLNKLGQRALNQGEIFFDDVRIPRHYMLTAAEGYEAELGRTLTFANTAMSVAFTGLARAAYEEALEYSRDRVQGGKAIFEHQLVQKHLFEIFTKVEACRALSRAAMIYNQTAVTPSLEHAIAAKTFCTQASFEVTSDALQIFGGNGLSKEYPMEKFFRDARASLIEDGTNDVLSLAGARQIIAKSAHGANGTALHQHAAH
jgi:alkylation response protein AidB-like acyl-CoA dehydrogenase